MVDNKTNHKNRNHYFAKRSNKKLFTQTKLFSFCSLLFTVFRLLTDFVCLYNYEFWLSLCKIVRSSVILLLLLLNHNKRHVMLSINKICPLSFIFLDSCIVTIIVYINTNYNRSCWFLFITFFPRTQRCH